MEVGGRVVVEQRDVVEGAAAIGDFHGGEHRSAGEHLGFEPGGIHERVLFDRSAAERLANGLLCNGRHTGGSSGGLCQGIYGGSV